MKFNDWSMERPNSGIILIGASLIALLLLSSSLVVYVNALTNWEGNDNGEFDCENSYAVCPLDSGYVVGASLLSSSITYAHSSGNVNVTFQYNPDYDLSDSYQTKVLHTDDPMYIQAGIVGNGTNDCIIGGWFISELVEYTNVKSEESNGNTCSTLTGLFTANSNGASDWGITEYTNSTGYINEVYTSASAGGSCSSDCSFSWSSNPIAYGYGLLWLRSNLCWCGFSHNTTSFDTGAGTFEIESGRQPLRASTSSHCPCR
jgi:hypothetical protein